MKDFSASFIDSIIKDASSSPRRRQHRNLHSTYQESCQRLFNAIGIDSYFRPHRHFVDRKIETLIAIRGLMALVLFDNSGNISQIVKFSSEQYSNIETVSVGVEVSPEDWHTVIALKPESILYEVKEGPFEPSVAKEWPSWAPEEGTVEAQQYLLHLRECALVR